MGHPRSKSPSTAFILAMTLALGLAYAEPGGLEVDEKVDQKAEASIQSVAALPAQGPDEYTARSLAWTGTLLPLGIGAAAAASGSLDALVIGGAISALGFTFGPSAGQFYAHSPGRALGAGIVRGLGGGMALPGLAMWIDESFCGFDEDGFEPSDRSVCGEGYGAATMIAGLVLLAGGTWYSITDAGPAVRRYHRDHDGARIGFTPTLRPGGQGAYAFGMLARVEW